MLNNSKLSKRISGIATLFIISLCTLFITGFVIQRQETLKEHAQTATNTVTINLSSPLIVSQFSTGATYTETDTIMNSNTSAQQLMKNALGFQNIFIMGWGAGNPEPTQGQYNWSDIDSRVQLAQNTGSKAMISLCCAPDWMKGGTAGQTNWNNLEVAPLASHYADFAELAKQVALRYKNVQYFQVWNELKGFWSDSLNRWDYEGYTQMYNLVYDAIKSVRPDAKIGGPYPVMASTGTYATASSDTASIDTKAEAVVSYWLTNKHGADFMVFDGGPGPVDNVKSSGVSNEFFAGQYYADVANWAHQQPGGENLPIGWAEWYPGSQQDWNDLNHFNAVIANDLIYTIKSGAIYALPWGISGDNQGFSLPEGIMTSAGQQTPVYNTFVAIKNYFSSGTQLYNTTNPATVSVLASKTKTLLVNHLGTTQTVVVNGTTVNLTPYQVVVINMPGGTTTAPSNVPTPTPPYTTPSYVCAGSPNGICPSVIATKTPTINLSITTQPSIAITPSVAVSTVPSTQPCQSITAQQEVTRHKKHKKGTNNNNGLLAELIGILQLLIDMITKLVGGTPASGTESPTLPPC